MSDIKDKPKKTAAAAKQQKAAKVPVVLAYKGFGPDWKCRDFQYKVGESYKMDGEAIACERGFHACEHPLDVFAYYPPAGNKFALVEQSGSIGRHDGDTKVASSCISIKAELDLPGIIKAAIEYTFSSAKQVDKDSPQFSDDEQGQASATGENGAASATGYSGAASATGYSGAASATGDRGAASATGYSGAASATGYRGAASATGYSGAASATGYSGAASATGYSGAASATGYRGAASATGYSGAASATGYSGAASATGESGAASATGENSAALASGRAGRAMAAEGCALFLVERDDNWGIVGVFAGIAGRGGIKAMTWYTLSGGKLVEAI
jgi:hypothetical protein